MFIDKNYKLYLCTYNVSLIHNQNKRIFFFFVTVERGIYYLQQGQDFYPGGGSDRKRNVSRVMLVPPLRKSVNIRRFAFKLCVLPRRCCPAYCKPANNMTSRKLTTKSVG